ncbi:sensor domain-containing diguanylate cyclase [Acidovorax sp. LjRoot129]|uniref:diguanylate cyclase domain-containing protein n=1 Tax=Acidovorax sp. LjRoot129 TaxID=3342260 RepID=UPI003ED16FFA
MHFPAHVHSDLGAIRESWRRVCRAILLGLMFCGAVWDATGAVHAEPSLHGDPLQLQIGASPQDAWPNIRILADPNHSLSAQQVLQQLDRFEEPARRGGSLGVREEAMWLHIPVVAPRQADSHWVLTVEYGSVQELDIVVARAGQVLRQQQGGYLRPPGPATLASRTPAMVLPLVPGERHELLVRVRSPGPLILPITISEQPVAQYRALREQMLQGFLNGVAFCLLVYSLIQYLLQRERLFGYYALVVFGSAGFSLQFFGIAVQFFWPGNVWMELHGAVLAGLLGLAGSFLFLCHTLAGAGRHSRYQRAMHAGAGLTVLCGLVFALDLLSVRTTTIYIALVGPMPLLLSLPAAVRRWRQRDPIGGTLLLAWTVFDIAVLVMAGLVYGVLPANFWTLHSFQIGATLDMLLFLRVMGLRTQALQAAAQRALHERDQMHALAHSDPLTGLMNRRGLQQALQAALPRATPERPVAVYLMDLDGFKPINDRHGHDVGDTLLVAVAQRLQGRCRAADVVARLGGDEFILMAPGLHSAAEAEALGRALLGAFEQPFAVGPLRLSVGLTIGYALAPLDSQDAQRLLQQADAAMYIGKHSGKRSLHRARAAENQLLS